MYSDIKFAIYFTKNKIGKINICVWITRKQKPCRQKLLSDKQIKFKEFCVSWNKCHKDLPRDSFKICFLKKMWFYMKYIVKNRGWRILMSMDCTYPNTSSTFYSNRRSFKYNANIIQVNTCTWWKPKIEEYELRDVRTI